MSSYVYNTSLSYPDYLQAKSFVGDLANGQRQVQLEVSRQTCQIVASSEDLAERGYRFVEGIRTDLSGVREDLSGMREDLSGMREDIQQGFDVLAYSLGEVTSELKELNARFHWGFSEVIAQLGRSNDSLKELVAIAKTPAQTWAYNQFEIGREAMRKKLWPEALEAINRAIDGHGDNTGYKLEYRFHYAKGTIHLGGADNTDPAVVDLKKAEEAFRNAARYGKDDYPTEAARAFLSAGWRAYCQGKIKEARDLTAAAKALSPQLIGEASFQSAKFAMHADDVDVALSDLRKAMEIDPEYGIRATSDGDFRRHEPRMRYFLENFRDDLRRYASSMKRGEWAFETLSAWFVKPTVLDATTRLRVESLIRMWEQARSIYARNAILAIPKAYRLAEEFVPRVYTAISLHRAELIERIEKITGGHVAFTAPRQCGDIRNRLNRIFSELCFPENNELLRLQFLNLWDLIQCAQDAEHFTASWDAAYNSARKHNERVRILSWVASSVALFLSVWCYASFDVFRSIRHDGYAVLSGLLPIIIPIGCFTSIRLLLDRQRPPLG